MQTKASLEEFCRQWDLAIEGNDPVAIQRFMSDDWICVGSDGITPAARFLESIRSGDLVHTRMDSDEMLVRLYENTGIVISRGTSAGTYKGQAFSLYEWSTSVFHWNNGGWICVMTMLTPAVDKK